MVNNEHPPEDELPDDGFFRVQKFTSRYLGCWPMDPGRVPFYAFINIFVLLVTCLSEFWFGVVHIDDLQASLDAFCPFTTMIVAWAKLVIFVVYKENFRLLLERLYKYYKSGKLNSLLHLVVGLI